MKALEKVESQIADKPVKLGAVAIGDVLRFAEVDYQDALQGDKQGFYLKISPLVAKTDRCTIVSLDGQTVLERDSDRLTFVHYATVEVSPAIKQ